MKKSINLDQIRLIASFAIVAIHVYPFASINETLDFTLTRILFRLALPIFLMITGYYLIPSCITDKTKLKNYTKKIIKIYLIAMIIFLPINIYSKTFSNVSFLNKIKAIFLTGTMYHLWYFPALILGIWITYYLIKYIKHPKYAVLILYTIGLLGDSYYGFISNISIFNQLYLWIFQIFDYTRNGLFYVPIFLYIGYSIKKQKPKKHKLTVYFAIFFILLLLIEGIILYGLNIQRHSSMYIFLIPSAYYLFELIQSYQITQNKQIRTMGTLIYILHPLFIIFINKITKIINIDIIKHSSIQYILVLITTTFFSYIILKIKELYNHARKEKNK